MRYSKITILILLFSLSTSLQVYSQKKDLQNEVRQTMLRATRYMVEKVSTNGGYVWYYPEYEHTDQLPANCQ